MPPTAAARDVLDASKLTPSLLAASVAADTLVSSFLLLQLLQLPECPEAAATITAAAAAPSGSNQSDLLLSFVYHFQQL